MSEAAAGRDAMPASLAVPKRRTLAAITERLIPSDEHGPGAREGNVVGYIERALASEYAAHRATYDGGLSGIEALATAEYGASFVDLGPEEQDAILAAIERGDDPSLSAFFELVLQHTREGMFGDPAWGGNAGQVGWALLGYAGPRREWTESEQQIEVIRVDGQPGDEQAP